MSKFTITNILKLYKNKEINSRELIQELYNNHIKYKNNNIYITDFFTELLEDRSLDNREILPIAMKDLYYIQGTRTTAASRMLKDFIAPCDSAIVKRLKKNNYVFTGKTNQDEFAMGSSGKTSYFGQTISTITNKDGLPMSPGGSSSGSAVALLAETCLASFGTDTGGSIRQPAAWCGLYGYKPTYGILSRHGIIEMAHSLDTPGMFTHNIEDMKYIFKDIIGKCSKDLTTVDYVNPINHRKKVALFIDPNGSEEIKVELLRNAKILEEKGYEIQEVNIELLEYGLPIYYIINTSEVASNMAKYNGILYNREFDDIYMETRTKCFGKEVKRRILLGNYVAYNIHYGNLYSHSLKVLQKMYDELNKIFNECDCILMPTYDGTGMTIEETNDPDPIKMYKCDLYTCFVNILGLPGLHVPTNKINGLPVGLQLVGNHFSDTTLFDVATILEQ